MEHPPDQFYTGLVADAYAPLRGVVSDPAPYERFVRRFGCPALELGCGHGEPLLDLVGAGLDVTGLDSSSDMLALCRAEAERRSLHVELFCQPMEQMDLGRLFNSIYLAGPTFQLIVDVDLARNALTRISSHLSPNGRAMIPLFRPQPTNTEAIGRWREHVTETGEQLAVQVAAENFQPARRQVDTTLIYRRGSALNPTEVLERIWSLCWYEDGEFEELVVASGLAIDRIVEHGEIGRTYVLGRVLDSRATVLDRDDDK